MNRSFLSLVVIAFFCLPLFAQSPVGVWKTIDDETGEAKSHVEIYEKNGKYYGKVIQLLQKPNDTLCDACPGDKKDKKIVGMEILWDLEPYRDYWSYGQVLDPENGKIYKCSIWLEENDKITIRGYIGVSLVGRNQEWHRVK
jgi:uncharacterized protein (DUF2147 family)